MSPQLEANWLCDRRAEIHGAPNADAEPAVVVSPGEGTPRRQQAVVGRRWIDGLCSFRRVDRTQS